MYMSRTPKKIDTPLCPCLVLPYHENSLVFTLTSIATLCLLNVDIFPERKEKSRCLGPAVVQCKLCVKSQKNRIMLLLLLCTQSGYWLLCSPTVLLLPYTPLSSAAAIPTAMPIMVPTTRRAIAALTAIRCFFGNRCSQICFLGRVNDCCLGFSQNFRLCSIFLLGCFCTSIFSCVTEGVISPSSRSLTETWIDCLGLRSVEGRGLSWLYM